MTGLRHDAVPATGLGVQTVIPTPDGYSALGTLEVGDHVFGEDGSPTTVESVTKVANARVFEVTFSTGEQILAGGDQLWMTDTFAERVREHWARPKRGQRPAYPPGPGGVRTTGMVASSLTAQGTANHAVRVAPKLRLPADESLPRHPYLLGGLLGERELRSPAPRDADAIPVRYLRGSAPQRRELLAGLLDKAGRPGARGDVVFTTSAVHIAWDVHELTCTLGYRPTVTLSVPRFTGARAARKTFHVSFVPDRDVFGRAGRNHIVTERALIAGFPDRHRYRYILRVREVPSEPLISVRVEGPAGLFLATRSLIAVPSLPR